MNTSLFLFTADIVHVDKFPILGPGCRTIALHVSGFCGCGKSYKIPFVIKLHIYLFDDIKTLFDFCVFSLCRWDP